MTITSNPDNWLLFPKPNPAAALRLFCFHHAGGSAQIFYPWLAYLPTTVEVGLIQLPGRGHRLAEPNITSLPPLSRIVSRELRQFTDKPFAFFGHSMGSLLCFEVARNLRRERHPEPAHIFVSASEAPHLRRRDEILSTLPKPALIEKLQEYNGAPPEVLRNDELMDLLEPAIRADFNICETYEYQPEAPLNCPITIYGGIEDYKIDSEGLAAWSELTTGPSNIRIFQGGHFYINTTRAIFLQTFARDLLQLCMRKPMRLESHR